MSILLIRYIPVPCYNSIYVYIWNYCFIVLLHYCWNCSILYCRNVDMFLFLQNIADTTYLCIVRILLILLFLSRLRLAKTRHGMACLVLAAAKLTWCQVFCFSLCRQARCHILWNSCFAKSGCCWNRFFIFRILLVVLFHSCDVLGFLTLW